MIRLYFIVEGQTEETFVKEVLYKHLIHQGVHCIARSVYTKIQKKYGRKKIYRGGVTNYDKAKNDIQSWIREDNSREAYFTTMFDLFSIRKIFRLLYVQ